MSEEWRPILGFERLYEASNFGRVRSLGRAISYLWKGKQKTMTKSAKVLSPYVDKDGYLRFKLCAETGIVSNVGAHQAVALAFIPNPHGLPQVAHKDHNRQNNVPGNLKWATNAENHQDSVAEHRYAKAGPAVSGRKIITVEIVHDIRARYARGERPTDIANAVGLQLRHALKIIKRERWAHV